MRPYFSIDLEIYDLNYKSYAWFRKCDGCSTFSRIQGKNWSRKKEMTTIDLKSNILTQKCFASLLVRYCGTCKMQLDSHKFDKPSRKNMQIEEPKSNSFIP